MQEDYKEYFRLVASSYQWQVWSAIRVLTLLEEAGVEGKHETIDSET